MLYVRIELWPRGDRTKSTLLGEATIVNQGGRKSDRRGDYWFTVSRRGKAFANPHLPGEKEVWKSFELKGFPRLSLTVWDLLYRALGGALGKSKIGV